MRKFILYTSLLLNIILATTIAYLSFAQQDKADYLFFRKQVNATNVHTNDIKNNVCFVGNSITANWANLSPDFFSTNNFINKGIGGQTSTQILLRFQQDVISTQPSIVVLNTGINDIGEGDGFYNVLATVQNIQSMIDICKANDIDLILTSVLPATEIYKNRFMKVKLVQEKIEELNIEIGKLVNRNGLKYVDYNSKLRNIDGTFNQIYTFDGIHPNEIAYKVMESDILKVINDIRNNENVFYETN